MSVTLPEGLAHAQREAYLAMVRAGTDLDAAENDVRYTDPEDDHSLAAAEDALTVAQEAYDAAVTAHEAATAETARWRAQNAPQALPEGRSVHIHEARCASCHETFNPADEDDLEHVQTEMGEPCGGPGILVGAWLS